MKDEIGSKLDEHIRDLLNKPALTNEDYAVLREKFSELPAKNGGGADWAFPILLAMILSSFGSGKAD